MSNDRKHSRFSPSGSKRWMACPGSISLEEKAPVQEESEYAALGTAAHALGEKCLEENTKPQDYLGQTIEGFAVDEDMTEAVQVYVDYINDIKGEKFIEQALDLNWLYKGMFGHGDCGVYIPEEKKAMIIDYKHGQGIAVDVYNNPQLMMYALGFVKVLFDTHDISLTDLETVEMVVVQPRAFHADGKIRSCTISLKDLRFWAVNVLRPAAVAADQPNAKLLVGEHCRFCKALAVCPALVENAVSVAKTDFNNPVLPDPSELSPADISKVLQVAEVISSWVDQVKALALLKMEREGVNIPGFKLVEKRATKKWVNEDQAAQALESKLGADAYETKLLTVAKATKALTKLKFKPKEREAILNGLWEKTQPGLTIAKESDKKPAVKSSAAADFISDASFLN